MRAKVKELFVDSVQSQFLQELRNYLLHYDPFSITYCIQWEEGVCTTPIYLDKRLLLRWTKWSRPVKEFIEVQEKGVGLWHVVESYYRKIHEFYDWLYDRQQEWFGKELSEMDCLFQQALRKEEELKIEQANSAVPKTVTRF